MKPKKNRNFFTTEFHENSRCLAIPKPISTKL
jgi:hypothetical protein